MTTFLSPHYDPALLQSFGLVYEPPRHHEALSATQVTSFSEEDGGCQRRWAFRKLEGLRGPPHPSAERGVRVHKVIERHLKSGVRGPDGVVRRQPLDLTTEEGQIALAGAHLWPTEPAGVEAPFTVAIGQHPFRGVIDVTSFENLHGFVAPVVTDHKTTVDLKYAKQPGDLLRDVQGAIYARVAFEFTGASVVRLKWIYYRTRGKPKAESVECYVEPHEIAPTLARVERVADRMKAISRSTRALQLAPNVLACEAYKITCPYIQLCNLSPQERYRSIMSQGNPPNPNNAQTFMQQALNGAPPGMFAGQQPSALASGAHQPQFSGTQVFTQSQQQPTHLQQGFGPLPQQPPPATGQSGIPQQHPQFGPGSQQFAGLPQGGVNPQPQFGPAPAQQQVQVQPPPGLQSMPGVQPPAGQQWVTMPNGQIAMAPQQSGQTTPSASQDPAMQQQPQFGPFNPPSELPTQTPVQQFLQAGQQPAQGQQMAIPGVGQPATQPQATSAPAGRRGRKSKAADVNAPPGTSIGRDKFIAACTEAAKAFADWMDEE